jgi:hypothetical protein
MFNPRVQANHASTSACIPYFLFAVTLLFVVPFDEVKDTSSTLPWGLQPSYSELVLCTVS